MLRIGPLPFLLVVTSQLIFGCGTQTKRSTDGSAPPEVRVSPEIGLGAEVAEAASLAATTELAPYSKYERQDEIPIIRPAIAILTIDNAVDAGMRKAKSKGKLVSSDTFWELTKATEAAVGEVIVTKWRVYYVTDRARDGRGWFRRLFNRPRIDSDASEAQDAPTEFFYGAGRSQEIEFGVCEVSVPF
jgi:hypothetical protein